MKRHPKPKRATKTVNIYNESYDVYAGSPQSGPGPEAIAPGEYGFLGNPYEDLLDHEEKLARYREYFLQRIQQDQKFKLAVLATRGLRLGCFCEEGETCHADIIADWLEGQKEAYQHLCGTISR